MNPDAASLPAGSAKRSLFNNWISAIGAVIAVGALFSFAFLVWMDFTEGDNNPYLGILTYLVAPAFLTAGLGLALFGAWAQRRWQIKHAVTMPDKWRLDFSDRRQRRVLVLFGVGALGFVLLSAFGSYQTYHYAESNAFCGEVCHEAMAPEFVTYKRGAHARVDCVECHVGSGAEWFIKAKINGAHQLVAYALDNYQRPIKTPLENLRPAQDTCERCHWPEKFHGNIDVEYSHFLSDKKNTPYGIRLLMRVNKGHPDGPPGGIHWHVSSTHRVEYFSRDEKRMDIPWMRVVSVADGSSTVYRTEDYAGDPPSGAVRVMDCMDCHNRPAHVFPAANDLVERSMAAGRLSLELPGIKRVAVQALLQEDIAGSGDAPGKIAAFLSKKYPDHPALEATIAEVRRIFDGSIFPERKADWRVYPDHIGHKDWPGCFRCHDGRHKSPAGEAVKANDCTSCHIILSQGRGPDLQLLSAEGQEFKHPDGELDPDLTCSDCHNGGVQK